MSERPGTGGAPGGSGDDRGSEFGWLYGKRPTSGEEPGPGNPDDQATRMLPVEPRPGGAVPPPPTQVRGTPAAPPRPTPTSRPTPPRPVPTPGPPPGGQGGRGGRGGRGGNAFTRFWVRRLRNPFWYVRFVLLLVLLFIVYTIAVPFVTWRSADQVDYEPNGNRPPEQEGTTYLLVGSDSRAGLSRAERRALATGDNEAELTDTIMILHTGSGPSVLLSVPRDTLVDQGDFGTGKINSAYNRGGPQLLVRIIERETGLRVDKYIEIGLGGVADVVDAVGGVEVCPTERLNDPEAGIDLRRGCQEVDGPEALGYARSRKQSALGDLERVRRQREVIGAIGQKVLSPWSVLNPVRWWNLNRSVPTFFRFGEGTSSLDAARWALAMTRTGNGDNRTCTVPVTDGSAETWDRERADPLFAAIAADDTDAITDAQCTPNGIPVP